MRRLAVLLFVIALVNYKYSFAEDAAVNKGDPFLEKSTEDVVLSDFILGPNDKVEIKVYRNDDLNYTVQIDPSGKISYPLLGDVQASGLTVFQLRDTLTKGLAAFIKDPQVTVNVSSYGSHTITVLGEVASPGLISIASRQTVLEVISRAGGFGANADKSNVEVIRRQSADAGIMTVNLKKALEGDTTQDILLKRDDIVYVPSATNRLTILGEVTTPGNVVLDRELKESPMMLLDAITKAGGFGSNADKTGVVLIRKSGDKVETKKFDIKKVLEEGDLSQNTAIQKGDIIYVPKIDQRVTIMGEITSPGTIQLDTPIRIFEAISRVGGFSTNADKNNVLLIRDDNGKSKVMPIALQRSLEAGDIDQNIVLQKGDVIYVPRSEKRVILMGEVVNPGYFSYDAPLTIVDFISKAGGFTANANDKKVALIGKGTDKSDKIKLIDMKKMLKEGDMAQNIVLQNGDIVYVPTTFIADVEAVLTHVRNIASTFTSVASPIVLWPQVKSALKGGESQGTLAISAQ